MILIFKLLLKKHYIFFKVLDKNNVFTKYLKHQYKFIKENNKIQVL